MKVLPGLCFVICLATPDLWGAPVSDLAGRYTALAIQGRLPEAGALLLAGGTAGDERDRLLAERYGARFLSRTERQSPGAGEPIVDAVVAAYRDYWTDALLNPGTPGAEIGLLGSLARILPDGAAKRASRGSESNPIRRVVPALSAAGFHGLTVTAPPLEDLFIWKNERRKHFAVDLTDRQLQVDVVFISGFQSLGWKDFASLGLATTTGWVDNGLLYCVEWAYAPNSERFDVSFLRHESRHLADFEQFPGLDSAEMEYRAKLTELAFADATLEQLLKDFTEKSAAGSGAPHAEANARVVRDIYLALHGRPLPASSDAWMTADARQVNRAARELLAQDTAGLESAAASADSGKQPN